MFLRDSGSEFQTGSKHRERYFPKDFEREARNCQQRDLKRVQCPRGTVGMKKVRKIWWHTVLTNASKTETSNFVLNLSLHWKPVECFEQ